MAPNLPKDDKEDLIMSYLGLRKSVGTIGVLLPIALLLATILNGDIDLMSSISHYYYTDAHPIFIGSLMIIGAFLGSYRGYPPQDGEWITDRQLALVAALGALVTALIPTDPETLASWSVQGVIHLVAAGTFLLAIGVLSFAKFARSHKHRGIYRVMGVVIFAVLALIALIMTLKLDGRDWMPDTWLFWLEAIAVWAFGISWLVKGKFLEDQYGARIVDWFRNLGG